MNKKIMRLATLSLASAVVFLSGAAMAYKDADASAGIIVAQSARDVQCIKNHAASCLTGLKICKMHLPNSVTCDSEYNACVSIHRQACAVAG